MDAYSMTWTSPSKRHLSKIYQDLQATRVSNIKDLGRRRSLKPRPGMAVASQYHGQSPAEKPHIGVIGAGLAGLRCADILLQSGFGVTVLEGRNRIGGRVNQQPLHDGYLVDIGPNWIHGEKENPILEIAKEVGTPIGTWDTRSYMYDQAGNLLSLEESERHSSIMWDIVQDAFKLSNKSCNDIDSKESLWEFFEQEVVKRIPDSEEDAERKREIVLQVSELWGAFIGSPIQRQSLKFFWLEECIEGENLFCAGTYKNILHAISKPVLEEADVKLEKTVKKISYRVNPNDKVKVETTGGDVFEFDDVVMTAPLGWLKRNLDAFEPGLPVRLTQAINSIGYGCLEKVYISFPTAFWLNPDEDGRKVQGFCQWLAPTYAPMNTGRWNQEVVELGSLTPTTSHPTLLFYTYGDESKYLTSEVGKLGAKEKKDAFILDFFKPYYSRLPHYSDSSPECQPLGCLTTDWLHDDLAGNGSYTNFQVGLEDGDWDIKTMREGLPGVGLWLAGEHTAPFVGLGTATGAYWSGEAVARRIAEEYGFVKKRNT